MTPDWKHPMTKDVYQAGLNDGRKSLEAEIARLKVELELSVSSEVRLKLKYQDAMDEIAKLRAALEEIVRNGNQGIHVPGPYDIAKAALTKEGK